MIAAFEPASKHLKGQVLRPCRRLPKPAVEFVRENLCAEFSQVPPSFLIAVRVWQEVDGGLLVQIRKGQVLTRRVGGVEPIQERLLGPHHHSGAVYGNHSLVIPSFGKIWRLIAFIRLLLCTRAALIAENLFLRKQLAFFKERDVKSRRITKAARLAMLTLARFFNWRDALVSVKPETFVKWHRTAFRLFWRWKSRGRGRPPLPKNIRDLIGRMAHENPTWGEERIANELKLKLGIHVSPRTVRKYLDTACPRGTSGQRWITFVRNHAKGIVACEFFISVTATFQVLYVLVAMELGSRRILHANVTPHPTAEWTIQQFREFLAFDHPYRFLIHDRDGIFSPRLDAELKGFGVRVLNAPVRAPKVNAFCERLIGTIRRECLDFLIPINERHLRRIITEFVLHYNRGQPHSALGPGIPEHPRPRFRPASIGTGCPPVIVSARLRFSAGCIMNTGWERRLRDRGLNFCGGQLAFLKRS